MSRYIDADKLINDLDYDVSCYPGGNDKSYIQVCDFKSMINGQPTADVVEVKRGEWVYYQEHHPSQYSMFPDDPGECGWMCSCCNELANRYMNDAYIYSEYNNKPMLPYCPNYGADMRGDRE